MPIMSITYSTYEAKAKFSEIIRSVRDGKTITVSYRGEPVAEIRPLQQPETIEQRTRELERKGVLVGPREQRTPFQGGVYVPGALETFLRERD